MKWVLGLALFLSTPMFAATWYVNATGGTRFSTNVPTGTCDGTSPAAPSGSTPNQHCAFNKLRMFWSDGSFTNTQNNFPGNGWIGASGDTYLIDCSGGTDCTIGQSGPNSGDWAFGVAGDPNNSGAPPPISGTPSAHTRILGKNFTSCADPTTRGEHLLGSWGAGYGIEIVSGIHDIDIQCLDIGDSSNCQVGIASPAVLCATSFPVSNYLKSCFFIQNSTTNIHIQDLNCHGTANTGFLGAPGDGWTLQNVAITGNPSAGWNMDDGSGTTGQGHFTATGWYVAYNGCAEQYPATGQVQAPWTVTSGSTWTLNGVYDCSSQSSGGYGDGVGTATTPSITPWIISIVRSWFVNNTQDGLDLLHAQGTGNTIFVSQSIAYGNMGNQFKIGTLTGITFTNNQIIGNCNAMLQTFPATPPALLSGGNTKSGLAADVCRGGANAVAIAVADGVTTKIFGNTMIAAIHIGYLLTSPAGGTCTTTCLVQYEGNIFVGYDNCVGEPVSLCNGNNTNIIFLDTGVPNVFANAGSSYDKNATLGSSSSCPSTTFTETNPFCPTPQLVDVSFHQIEYGNMTPSSGTSNILGIGPNPALVSVDYNGNTRPSPMADGAFQLGLVPPTSLTVVALLAHELLKGIP